MELKDRENLFFKTYFQTINENVYNLETFVKSKTKNIDRFFAVINGEL